MFLYSNFFRYGADVFFYTKYYLKNSFFVIIFLVTSVMCSIYVESQGVPEIILAKS